MDLGQIWYLQKAILRDHLIPLRGKVIGGKLAEDVGGYRE